MYWLVLGINALPLSSKKKTTSGLCYNQTEHDVCVQHRVTFLDTNGDLFHLSCFPSSSQLFVLAVTDPRERDV